MSAKTTVTKKFHKKIHRIIKQNMSDMIGDIARGERPGKIITNNKTNDRYVLIKSLGSGSYATVWMCYKYNEKKLFALKIFTETEQKVAKYESNLYQKLKNMQIRNIINTYGSFVYEDKMCVVIELTIGSLHDVINYGRTKDGRDFKTGFDVQFVTKILQSVLIALKDIHSNRYIHADIKPENILLCGETEYTKNLIIELSKKKTIDHVSVYLKNTISKKVDSDTNNRNSHNRHNSCNSHSSCNSYNSSISQKIGTSDSFASVPPDCLEISDNDTLEYNDDNGDKYVNSDETDNSDYNNSSSDPDSHDSLNNEDNDNIIIDNIYIDNPQVKVSDLGSFVALEANKKSFGVETRYYKPPESLVVSGYDTSCDIWALGCTIYELCTSVIMFNPELYNADPYRCTLHQISETFGAIPDSLIEKSQIKDVLFTPDHVLKGSNKYNGALNDKKRIDVYFKLAVGDTVIKYMLCSLMLDMLEMDPTKRLTASDALKHQIYSVV
jgi:serine/threonine protein kinase